MPAPAPRRLQRTAPVRKAPTAVTLPDPIERLLQARARGRCEFCAKPIGTVCRRHHRWMRSQGGVDDIRNVTLVHVNCHNAIHQNVMWSRENGWIIDAPHRSYTRRKLTLHAGQPTERRVLLTSSGDYQDVA